MTTHKKVPCPNCGGRGVVRAHTGHCDTKECNMCKGSGELDPREYDDLGFCMEDIT